MDCWRFLLVWTTPVRTELFTSAILKDDGAVESPEKAGSQVRVQSESLDVNYTQCIQHL